MKAFVKRTVVGIFAVCMIMSGSFNVNGAGEITGEAAFVSENSENEVSGEQASENEISEDKSREETPIPEETPALEETPAPEETPTPEEETPKSEEETPITEEEMPESEEETSESEEETLESEEETPESEEETSESEEETPESEEETSESEEETLESEEEIPITEEETLESEEEVPYALADMTGIAIDAAMLSDGTFDYRTCVGNGMKAGLKINVQNDTGDLLSIEELGGVSYEVTIFNTAVLRIDDGAEHDYAGGGPCTYELSQNTAGIVIAGIGATGYEVRLKEGGEYLGPVFTGHAEVKDTGLLESDYYIQIDGSDKKYELGEWKTYLEDHGGWVNGNFKVMLSDSGKNYFDIIKTEWTGNDGVTSPYSGIDALKPDGYGRFEIWAENSTFGANTKNAGGWKHLFEINVDTDASTLQELSSDSKCYVDTMSDSEQYFPEHFVLKGRFDDKAGFGTRPGGIKKIEYTADALAGEVKWAAAENKEMEQGTGAFSITLPDGIYSALAVRAVDFAGNVSAAGGFLNSANEYIKVVVDTSRPVIDVRGISGGAPYSGEGDIWTNNDVTLDVAPVEGTCRYAGIYKYEYTYEKIGDALNRPDTPDMADIPPEEWIVLSPGGDEDNNADITIADDKNGYYYFRAVSKSGIASETAVKKRVLVQRGIAEIKPMLVSGADVSKCKGEWYNKESGVPLIQFEYPEYDTGAVSGEYDAPVAIHYKLTTQTQEAGSATGVAVEKTAEIGVMGSSDAYQDLDGVMRFLLTEEDLGNHVIKFGYDEEADEADDGIYTLEYWIADRAGNISEKETQQYKIDLHEPTNLSVELAGRKFDVGEAQGIVYTQFYKEAVSGSVSAEYGISGKGSLAVLKAKKVGEWKNGANGAEEVGDGGVISIGPNKRCFLYVRAEDGAGNVSEGWTMGIVVDNMAPNQASEKELIIEPKGANRHGFFNGDVKVEISVKDSPENDDCAALKSVTESIGKNDEDTISDKELFSFTKESPTYAEISAASSFEDVQTVSAAENESNDAYVEITAVDRSGNSAKSVQRLKIDVTAPQLDISFDNDDAQGGSFYREARTADIHVRELNFDASAVDIRVTRDGEAWEYALSDWTSDGIDHHASITFAQDGEYAIEARCTDLADNSSGTVKADVFTIDRTAPVLTLDLNLGQAQPYREGYFNGAVTAVVTVREHNFNPDGLVVEALVSGMGEWSHDGDMHTMPVLFTGDNIYDISCVYTDMAGNTSEKAQQQFVIDTQAPQIVVAGIEDGAAINGQIAPVVTAADLNMEMEDIKLTLATGMGETLDMAAEAARADENGAKIYTFMLTDMNGRPDNIYYLTATAHDSAGNESSLTYRFSLNRSGSAYDLTQLVELMGRQYVRYAGMEDIKVIEMNIDTVDEFALYVSRNGELGYSAVYDREVSGSVNTGYTYIYRIRSDNFKDEGTYKLTLYSKDRAGNEINNKKDINGSEISFIIDNTAPKAVIDGVESGMLYDAESKEVHVSVTDNFKLAEAEFTLVNKKGELLKSWDYMAACAEGELMAIVLPQYKGEVSLLYRVKDAAGNELQTFQNEQAALADILVTTDKFTQIVTKPTQTGTGRTLIALVCGIMALPASAVMIKKWKKVSAS